MSASDQPDLDQLVCFCHSVTRATILDAIRNGAVSLKLIKERTSASTGCGGCEWEVLEILSQELKNAQKKS